MGSERGQALPLNVAAARRRQHRPIRWRSHSDYSACVRHNLLSLLPDGCSRWCGTRRSVTVFVAHRISDLSELASTLSIVPHFSNGQANFGADR